MVEKQTIEAETRKRRFVNNQYGGVRLRIARQVLVIEIMSQYNCLVVYSLMAHISLTSRYNRQFIFIKSQKHYADNIITVTWLTFTA